VSLSEASLQGYYTKVARSRKRGLNQWQKCDGSSQWKLCVKRYVIKEWLKTASDECTACVVKQPEQRRWHWQGLPAECRRGHSGSVTSSCSAISCNNRTTLNIKHQTSLNIMSLCVRLLATQAEKRDKAEQRTHTDRHRQIWYVPLITLTRSPLAVMLSWQHTTYKPSELGQTDLVSGLCS